MRRTIIDTTNLELTEKVVSIKRVTKVVKGGPQHALHSFGGSRRWKRPRRRWPRKVHRNSGSDPQGKEDATKHLVPVALDENNSITHDFLGKYGSSTVLLKKAPDGTGIIAGGPARIVCELAGIKNIRTKALGSTNKQNVVLATIQGLSQLKTPEEVAAKRGKSVEEIHGLRRRRKWQRRI